METSMEPVPLPLVVLQTDHHGRETIVGLAFETDPIRKLADRELPISSNPGTLERDLPIVVEDSNESVATSTTRTSGVDGRDLRMRSEESVAATLTTTSGRLIKSQPPHATHYKDRRDLRNRLRLTRLASMQGLELQSTVTVDHLVEILFEDDLNDEIQNQVVKTLADLSRVDDNRLKIAHSFYAMTGLTRLLFAGNPSSQYHAAVALGNVAAVEDNVQIFKQCTGTVTGLVKLLFGHDNVLAQKGAAMALANLSFWRDGGTLVLYTPRSVTGLVGLTVTGRFATGHCGQEEAKRALVNLAFSPNNRRVLEVPKVLAALAGLASLEDVHNLSTSPLMHEQASRALASLSYTTENAQKISESEEFPLVLAVLVRLLTRTASPMTVSTESSVDLGNRSCSARGLAVQKMAAMALANLSITEHVQLTVADFPDALAGLFMSLEARDDGSSLSLQLQECAAMAIGNLALAPDNRRRIMEFGSYGLASLASVLFQDENPSGQEYAAWALANLSHHPCDSENTKSRAAAIEIAEAPNVLRGLERLMRIQAAHQESIAKVRVQEQAVRAMANLSYPHENQTAIARVPNLVKTLSTLLSRHSNDPRSLNPMTQEHAARALANLTCAMANWKSFEIFCDAIPGLVDLLWSENIEVTQKTREYGAIAVGNFALNSANHWTIVSSRHAMMGLVRMLKSNDNPGGKELAAWVLANLAQGNYFVKIVIAHFPFALTGLVKLSKDDSSRVLQQARRALAELKDVLCLIDGYGSIAGIPETSFDLSNPEPLCRVEIPSLPVQVG